MSYLFSLIIPVYKVEQYIEECLESIIIQLPATENKVEIIIVDDGSPDRSIEIIKKLLSQQSEIINEKFKIIQQSNQGVSVARNIGLRHAKGKYIGFLDSDDLMRNNYFKDLFEVIEKYNPDIVEFSGQRFKDNKLTDMINVIKENGFFDLDYPIRLRICSQGAWYPWLRIYKSELFDNITFPVGKNYEDPHTIPYVVLKAKNIYFLDKVLINYRITPNSITNTQSTKNINDLGGTVEKMLAYFSSHPELISAAITLAYYYIGDSLKLEGYGVASRRWEKLKAQIVNAKGFDQSFIAGKRYTMFFNYGLKFLFCFEILKKLRIRS